MNETLPPSKRMTACEMGHLIRDLRHFVRYTHVSRVGMTSYIFVPLYKPNENRSLTVKYDIPEKVFIPEAAMLATSCSPGTR